MVAKNTAPKAPRASRAKNKTAAAPAAAETLVLAHATQFIDAGDAALNDLISGLGEPDEVIERADEVETLDLPAALIADEAGDAALSELGDLIASLNEPDEVIEAPARAASVEPDAEGDALSDLIASLEVPAAVYAAPAVVEMDDAMLNAAVSSAEATEASVFAATPDGVVDAGAVPTGSASDVVPDAPTVAADAAPKRVPVPRKHYTDKTERLKDKLGTSLGEYSVLTLADAVNEDELAAKMEQTMVIIKGMSGKAQNWAVKLVEYLAGKKSSMSEVTLRIFKLLEKDGFVTTGATGNLYLDLISKPYSPGAARAMGGNNLAALSGLKIIASDGKGRWIANPDSLLMMKARSMLFAAPAAEVVSEIAASDEPDMSAEGDSVEDEAMAAVASLEAEVAAEYEDALL